MLGVLAASVPGGWSEQRGRARAVVLRVPRIPAFNRVMAVDAETDPADVAALVERVARGGAPHIVETSPEAGAVLRWCREAGLLPSAPVPLMACHAAEVTTPATPTGVTLDRLPPERLGEHLDVAAAGFEAPRADFSPLDASTMLADARVAAMVAGVEGEPAATGLSVTVDDWVGVFVVATVPRHRRHGLGALVTARLVRDALDRHRPDYAVLQSSAMGLGVYAGLGFAPVAEWTRWRPPS